MNRCEHGQKITKFCITEHCHHKESAGCDYCIRKYHFHLTSTLLLTEADIEAFIKNLTLPTDIKYKARNLQETAIDYLRNLKIAINNWIDQAQNSIADRLGYPTLRKQGLLTAYNRLKQKEYRKINAKELRMISQFAKNNTPQSFKKEQLSAYYEQVDWTMSIIGAVDKVAAQISKLPEAKEGEGPIQMHNKAKLNEIYESIKREKEKRDIQSKTIGIEGNTHGSGYKLEENSLVRRRQSSDKKSFDNNELANEFKEIIDRKVIEPPNDPKFAAQREKSVKQPLNNNNQSEQETRRSLRRRRSSIDDKFDLKFGANDDKLKEAKQNEERKRKIVEKIEHQRKLSQDKLQKRDQSKPRMQRQFSQKVAREEDSIMGNLLNMKLANKRQQLIKKEEESFFNNQIAHQPNRMTLGVEKTQYTDIQKSEISSRQASENNFMGMVVDVLNNILPPLPPTAPKANPQDTYVEKVFKIPVPMNHYADQIQSPIMRSKKRQQEKQSTGTAFGINLIPTADKVVQKTTQGPLIPIVQTQAVDQSSLPAFSKRASERQKQKPKEQVVQKQKQDDLLVLEKNQKNSLLLVSQALKSPGDRAIQLLKAALKYSPQNLSAAEYLSYLYLQSAKPKQCIEVCQSILVHIQDTPQQFELTLHLHNNKAAALNQLGRYSESIMILQKCLRFRRKHYFYKNLGDAYFCLGIPEKAAMNYDKAIKLDPQSDEAFYNLAVTQFIQQQYTSAQLNIGQALKIEAGNENYLQLSQQIEKRLSNLAM